MLGRKLQVRPLSYQLELGNPSCLIPMFLSRISLYHCVLLQVHFLLQPSLLCSCPYLVLCNVLGKHGFAYSSSSYQKMPQLLLLCFTGDSVSYYFRNLWQQQLISPSGFFSPVPRVGCGWNGFHRQDGVLKQLMALKGRNGDRTNHKNWNLVFP